MVTMLLMKDENIPDRQFPTSQYFVTPVIDSPISRSHAIDPNLRWVELVWVEGFGFLDAVYDGNLRN
jgi:hypothetical protein